MLAASLGSGIYLASTGREATDNARLNGRIVGVTPGLTGRVARILVDDNDLVEAGDVVVELDDADYKLRVSERRAELAAAEASLRFIRSRLGMSTDDTLDSGDEVMRAQAVTEEAKAELAESKAAVAAARSRRILADADLARVKKLRETQAVSQSEIEAKNAAATNARAEERRELAKVAAASARIRHASGGQRQVATQLDYELRATEARFQLAEVQLAEAELALSRTKVLAPIRGVVARRSVEPGVMVNPNVSLLAIVSRDQLWIDANFKENQVAQLKPGQPATVLIDAYPSLKLAAHVESIAAATASKFSLLPSENASGNFVKVTQRVGVRLRFDATTEVELRPGMSAIVTVETK